MAFQIKSFTAVAASMLNYMRGTTKKVTDFNIGGVVRTMLEAIAIEIEELYQQYFNGLKEAIPVSLYTSLGFNSLPALPAYGLLRVTVSSSGSDVLIQAGTVFSMAGGATPYVSSADVTIPAGQTQAYVRVVAAAAGVVGNILAGQSFSALPVPTHFVSATNLSAFTNGAEVETDSAKKVRFINYIQSLNRGTVAAINYGLSTVSLVDSDGIQTERVASSSLIEPWLTDDTQPVSLVKAYIHNGVGSTSSALLAQAQNVIYGYYDALNTPVPGWKAAGVKVQLFIATEQAINVAGVLTPAAGYDKPTLIQQAGQVLFAYLQSLPIGTAAIKSEMIKQVKEIQGVYNIVFSAPSGDVAATEDVKLMPGTFTLT